MGKIMLNGISYGGGGGGTTGDYLNKVDPEGSGTMILNLESTSSRPGTSTRNVIFGNHNISTGTNLNDSMIQGLSHNITATGGYHHVEGHNNTLSASGYATHIEGDSNAYTGSGNYNHIEGHSHVLSGPGDENHLGGASCTLAGGDLLQNFIQGAYNNITGSRFRNVTILGNNNANNGTSMDRSTIIGSYNRVFSPGNSIDDTVIIGQSSTAYNGFNVNLGYFNKSAGTNAFLFGSSNSINTTANQSNNIMIGVTNYISASTSDKNMIFGYNNYVTGNKAEYNTVIGNNTTATYNSRYNTILGYASKFNGTTGSDKNVILGSFNEITDNSVSRVSGSIIGGYMSTISANGTGNGVIEGGSVFGRSIKLNMSTAADGSLMYGPFVTGYWSNLTLKGYQYGGLYNLAFMDPVIGHNQGGIVSGYYSTVNVANIKGSIIGGLGMKATCDTLEGAFVYGSASTVDSKGYMYGTWIGGENINYSSTVSPYGGIVHGFMTTVKDSNIYGGIIAGEGNSLTNADIEGGLLVGRANNLTGEVESIIVGGFYSTVSDSKYSLVSGYKNNVTSATYSVVGGNSLIANAENQTIFGKFNATPTTATAFAIGNGTTDARSNALTVNWDGSAELANDLTVHYGGTAYNVGQCLSTASGGGGSSVNYSSTEHAVGTWIDGSTVYERTIVSGYMPYTSDPQIIADDLADWNIGMVVEFNPIIQQGFGEYSLSYSYAYQASDSGDQAMTPANVFIKTHTVDNVDKLCIIAYPGTAEFESGIVIVTVRYIKATT